MYTLIVVALHISEQAECSLFLILAREFFFSFSMICLLLDGWVDGWIGCLFI